MDITNLGNDFNIYTMKYLKRFNESVDESNIEEIKQTIKDILLPISDMGYDISVTKDESQLIIRVVSCVDQSLWINDEVKEEFIRMKDYLQSEGYNSIDVLYELSGGGSITIKHMKKFDDFMKFESWQKVKTYNLIFVVK